MKPYIMDVWYMVAWSDELSDAMFAREFLGRGVLLTRARDGSAVVMRDRCPHRFAPLSLGRRQGDRIICGYHGLEFNEAGRCVANPFSSRIPPRATLTRFPAVERDGIVWAWFGNPAKADPALVPDLSPAFSGPPGRKINGYTHGHTCMDANYEYGTDNLLDLSHVEYVHTLTFGGTGVILKGQHKVEQTGQQLHSNWWMPNVPCPPGFKEALQTEIADHWMEIRWEAPGSMYLDVGATRVGQTRESGESFHQAHVLVPANEGKTHYFWSSATSLPQTPEEAAAIGQLVETILAEDKVMIEAAYRNVETDFWEENPISLGVDSAGARARRMIQAMKRAEAGVSQAD